MRRFAQEDRPFLREDLIALFKKQKGRCNICGSLLIFIGRRTTHLDHIIPKSKGGINALENLQFLCMPCNIEKKDHLLLDNIERSM